MFILNWNSHYSSGQVYYKLVGRNRFKIGSKLCCNLSLDVCKMVIEISSLTFDSSEDVFTWSLSQQLNNIYYYLGKILVNFTPVNTFNLGLYSLMFFLRNFPPLLVFLMLLCISFRAFTFSPNFCYSRSSSRSAFFPLQIVFAFLGHMT